LGFLSVLCGEWVSVHHLCLLFSWFPAFLIVVVLNHEYLLWFGTLCIEPLFDWIPAYAGMTVDTSLTSGARPDATNDLRIMVLSFTLLLVFSACSAFSAVNRFKFTTYSCFHLCLLTVMPLSQRYLLSLGTLCMEPLFDWIPAYAGMTNGPEYHR